MIELKTIPTCHKCPDFCPKVDKWFDGKNEVVRMIICCKDISTCERHLEAIKRDSASGITIIQDFGGKKDD